MRPPRYWLRRLVVVLAQYDHTACRLWSCPEPTVGLTVWCREHVDQIWEDRKCPELVAAIAEQRAAP